MLIVSSYGSNRVSLPLGDEQHVDISHVLLYCIIASSESCSPYI